MLEPYEGKPSRTVLRGEGGSNTADLLDRPRDIEQREGRILRQGNRNEEVEIFTYVTQDSFDANMWEKVKNKAMIIAQAMSGNLIQRKIEDMDVAALSYAEAEALATGNPLMAEKTMVDADVIKYSMLQNEYYKQLRYNERQIEKLPKEIERIERSIENIKADIKNRQPIGGERFKIKLGQTVYVKRAEAEMQLAKIAKDTKSGADWPIGEFGGFELMFHKGCTEDGLRLVGQYSYAIKSCSIRSAEYTLMNVPELYLTSKEASLKELQKKYKDLQTEVQRPFEYEDKLKELLSRQNEINREIEKSVKGEKNKAEAAQEEENPELEKLYQLHSKKVKVKFPSLRSIDFVKFVVKSLQREGHTEEEIKGCMRYSVEMSNMRANLRDQRVSFLFRKNDMSHVM